MGARLHYAIKYRPEWEGAYFNRDVEAWEQLFDAHFAENGWKNETGLQYEVYRGDVQAYIDELVQLDDVAGETNKNEYFVDYTNEQVADILRDVLLSEDDNIRIEWF